MNIGDALPPRTIVVDAGAMAIIAVVLRDPNPIHLDPKAVRTAGLGDKVINQGPANLAYIIDMVLLALPGHRITALDSRYLGNVCDGDTVEAGGTIAGLESGKIQIETWLRLPDESDAVTARMTLVAAG